MYSHELAFLPFLSLLIILSSGASVRPSYFETLGSHEYQSKAIPSSYSVSDFKTLYFTQSLDHFNYRPESYTTFKQKYLISAKYWGGANSSAPIFVYLGPEKPLEVDPTTENGFVIDNAPQFKALIVIIEHRYYGESIPFGSRDEAFQNASTLGYFNSAQALADYAEILIHIKKRLGAQLSPVIVIGASYGGMLASWFRLKYPHVALGALASSAPVLLSPDIVIPPEKEYFAIVSKDFRDTSESCYQTIKRSWSEIDKIASQRNGLSSLSKKFHTCRPLSSVEQIKSHLKNLYREAAQYDNPPTYPVSVICDAIDQTHSSPNETTLKKIFAGMIAYRGNNSCYNVDTTMLVSDPISIQDQISEGWFWQTCSEIEFPMGINNNGTMFPPSPFNLTSDIMLCNMFYNVSLRPHWVSTYYGGQAIRLTLRRFASNVIFSNGLRDPFSGGGVLHSISKNVVAVTTEKGAHALDMASENNATDPVWLVKMRKTEVKIIRGWLSKYYADLDDV